jgi:hypothetical protein
MTRILIHVPYGNLPALAEKFRRFGEELTKFSNVPNPWVANLQRITRAALDAMWTDDGPCPNDNAPRWWQLWVRRSPETNWDSFEYFADKANLRMKPGKLKLPEHFVVVVQARRSQLESSLDLLNTLSEVRAAPLCHYEFSGLSPEEQHEWIGDALGRIQPPGENAPAVCLLDTGINRGHRLLEPVLLRSDNHTIFGDNDPSDSDPGSGHGTMMAGLAAYSDIRDIMHSAEPWIQGHRLEGVKMFDWRLPHEPENYGAVTIQAVTTPEGIAPNRRRVFSMPITATGDINGKPSAWSAAVDSLAFGAEEEGEPKRLILISAGNVDPTALGTAYVYPNENLRSPIEDPAQAWNAITVGAISHRDRVFETDPESLTLVPIAQAGTLSPYSRTSIAWDAHWPIKPEIVMEGGNAGFHPLNGPERRHSLELLSTSKNFSSRPIAAVQATSAATALAARMAAEIRSSYPELWPETVRGLLVHSARWNDRMLNGLDPHRPGSRSSVEQLLRTYGFGEPDGTRARASFQNQVTLFREDAFTPYRGSAGGASINDCHVHQLRLPTNLLQSLGATTCKMRVTLSYFTAPNPSASNRIPGSRYRYGGCLLRFRVRHKDEADTDFMSLVAREANEDEATQQTASSIHDPAWALGPSLRSKGGSIIHDVWQGNAADLAAMDHIAIFPVKGWWASRSFQPDSPWYRCHRRPMRYSLIVSLETMADVPLYNEISNLISVPLDAS